MYFPHSLIFRRSCIIPVERCCLNFLQLLGNILTYPCGLFWLLSYTHERPSRLKDNLSSHWYLILTKSSPVLQAWRKKNTYSHSTSYQLKKCWGLLSSKPTIKRDWSILFQLSSRSLASTPANLLCLVTVHIIWKHPFLKKYHYMTRLEIFLEQHFSTTEDSDLFPCFFTARLCFNNIVKTDSGFSSTMT